MIKAIVSDFSNVLLFASDSNHHGKLNDLHKQLLAGGDYDPWQHFRLNQELLDFYQTQAATHDLYIFTTEYIQDYPPIRAKLGNIFKKILIGADLGLKKTEVATYQAIAKMIGLAPAEIVFVDDIQAHVAAANSAGLQTVWFENTATTLASLKQLLQ